MTMGDWIGKYCSACGGNWTAMLLSGIYAMVREGDIKAIALFEALPEQVTFNILMTGLRDYKIITEEDAKAQG